MAAFGSDGADNLKKSSAGMGRCGARSMHEPEAAGDFEFGDGDLNQFATSQLRLDGKAGNEGDAVAARDESFDGFEAGQLDPHVERGLMTGEGLDDTLAQRRCDGMGNEIFCAEFSDGDLLLTGEWMFWVHHKDDGVGINGDSLEARVIRAKGKHPELHGAIEDLIGDLAGKGALDGDTDVGVVAAKGIQDGQEPETGVFIGGDGKPSALQRAQFFESGDGFAAQPQKAFSIAAQKLTGRGESAVARGSIEEGFADFLFQLADGMADGGLGAAHSNSGPGEAFFFNDGEEGLELVKVHKRSEGRGTRLL